MRARNLAGPVVVFAVALAVRLVYLWQSRSSPLFEHPNLDAEFHVIWAKAIAAGQTLFPGPYFRAPLYPALLGLLYRIAGPGFLLPRVIQCVMGSATCVLVYWIGRDAFGRAVGWIAGLAAATYWIFVYFDGELLLEPLSVFLNLAALWLMLIAARRAGWAMPTLRAGTSNPQSAIRNPQAGGWAVPTLRAGTSNPQSAIHNPQAGGWAVPTLQAGAGLLLGLSAINRPNVVAFMPLAAAWIVYLHRTELRRGLVRAALFGIACLVPILPVTVRNCLAGDFVLIAWQGGPNLYIGNNPQSDGITATMPGARADWWGGYHDWITMAEMAERRQLKPSEVSRFYSRQAWRFIVAQPKRAAMLMTRKFLYFWNQAEVPNPTNPYFFARRYGPITAWLPLHFGMIAPLALVGLWLSRREAVRLFPLWGFGLVYMATVVAFFVTGRFRLPVVPILMVYAAYALVRVMAAVRGREWRVAVGGAAAAGLLWPVVNTGVPASYIEDPGSHCMVGLAYLQGQRYDEAMGEYEAALRVEPGYAKAYEGIANVHMEQRRYEEAVRGYRQALEQDPRAPVHANLALALSACGRFAEATEALRAGLAVTPGYLELERRLAWLLATCPSAAVRNGPEAVKLARRVVDIGGATPETLDTLAAAYAEAGRFAEAMEAATAAVEMARQGGRTDVVEQIERRLAGYRRREPYREARSQESGAP